MGMLFFLFAFRLKNSETRRVTLFARIFQCLKITEKVALLTFGQTVLPQRSILRGQNLVENA